MAKEAPDGDSIGLGAQWWKADRGETPVYGVPRAADDGTEPESTKLASRAAEDAVCRVAHQCAPPDVIGCP